MFTEGDEVFVTQLNPTVQSMLEDVMECDFKEIEFFFMEYHDDTYAVLSAETDYKFAIMHCPLVAIEGYHDDAATADELIDHVINTLVLDSALEKRDRALFDAVLAYNAEKEAKPKKEIAQHLYMHLVEEMTEEEWNEVFGDE